jgi:hypothetical protein
MMNLQEARMSKDIDPLTKKERLNRNIVIACCVLGGILGIALATANNKFGNLDNGGFGFLNNNPVPELFAITIAIIIGILVPLITYFWCINIDEQELHAYKEGCFWGMHIYMFGAPIWWILWRGGILSQPDGIVIFYATIIPVLVVWLKKKYF